MQNRLFIVHGYQANPQKHWFEWLTQQFPHLPHHIVSMPDSQSPKLHKWLDTLQDAIGTVDEHTYIIGHSLGCTTVLQFLAKQAPFVKVGGVLLVAGFVQRLDNLPQLDAFNQQQLPWPQLQSMVTHKQVLLSQDDEVVSPSATEHLSQLWQAPLLKLSGYGHFTEQDGCKCLPEAQHWLHEALQSSCSQPERYLEASLKD